MFRAHRDRQLLVVKVSSRTPASLAWELEVLRTLHDVGLRVPVTVPTVDGRDSRDGVVIQTFLPGHPPQSRRDWTGVAAFITRVHDLTRSWPQRPGSLGIRQLLTQDRGGDVDLTAMPAPAAALVRSCWGALLAQLDAALVAGTQRGGTCVIHGDLEAGAVLVHDGEIGVIDWDEARVDVPVLDLTDIPGHEVPLGIDPVVVQLAALAWETATCWVPEPRYASSLLDQLRDATSPPSPDHHLTTWRRPHNRRWTTDQVDIYGHRMPDRRFERIELRTARLLLRAPSPADQDEQVLAYCDPETQHWLPLPRPHTEADAEAFAAHSARVRTEGQGVDWVIDFQGRYAGSIDLKHADWMARSVEVGYLTAPWARGRV